MSAYFHFPPPLCRNPWFFSDMTFIRGTAEFRRFFWSLPNIINLFNISFPAKSIFLYH